MNNTIKHNGNLIDLSNLSREELCILKIEIEDSIRTINNQISEAKQKAARYNDYSDPSWFRAANGARKFNVKKLDLINIALSSLKEKNRSENIEMDRKKKDYPFSYYFQNAAKKHISEDDYNYICRLAELYRADDIRNGIKIIQTATEP